MSKKNTDKNNRLRDVTVGFRVSKEEDERLNALVQLSGMNKQDYILHRLENEGMTIYANPRTYFQLKTILSSIHKELSRLSSSDELSPFVADKIELVLHILDSMQLNIESNQEGQE